MAFSGGRNARFTRRFRRKRTFRRRRFTGRRRVTRRPRKLSGVTRKKVLNTTARKRKDQMVCMTWDGTKWTKAGLALNGTADSNQMFIWSASARDRIAFTTGPGEAARESEHVFMRGLKENVEIQTDTAQQWQWRRIVFSNKGHFGTNAFTSIASLPNAGYGRGVLPLTGTYLSSVEAEVFRGTDTNDWVDPYLCPLNNDRITVHSDERHVIGGGFQGSTKMFKKWNAFNKNFVYNDQQNGSSYTTEPFASTGKRGMGDIFVIDMFRAGFGASATDHLEYRPNSTLYWHER